MLLSSSTLGQIRLKDVHKRVNFLLKESCYREDRQVQNFDLCKHCEIMEALDMSVPMADRKETYMNCSGVDWVCQAMHEVNKHQSIPWSQFSLMKPQFYSRLVLENMKGMEPRTAMHSINNLNKELKLEQPHMVNSIHVTEELMYNCYMPLKVVGDVLPVPPEGKEYVQEYVAPDNVLPSALKEATFRESYVSKCACVQKALNRERKACTQCGNTDMLMAMKAMEDGTVFLEYPYWNYSIGFLDDEKNMVNGAKKNHSTLQVQLDLARAKALVNSTCAEMIANISALTGIQSPCEFCQTTKRCTPDRVLHCSGVQELCVFKYEFFRQWPAGMVRERPYNNQVLNCSTVARYQEILNQIFSLKYLERAIRVKYLLDTDLLAVQPHLSPVVKEYNCLLYRYYWPYALSDKEGAGSSPDREIDVLCE